MSVRLLAAVRINISLVHGRVSPNNKRVAFTVDFNGNRGLLHSSPMPRLASSGSTAKLPTWTGRAAPWSGSSRTAIGRPM
jgi:hypothetical protein